MCFYNKLMFDRPGYQHFVVFKGLFVTDCEIFVTKLKVFIFHNGEDLLYGKRTQSGSVNALYVICLNIQPTLFTCLNYNNCNMFSEHCAYCVNRVIFNLSILCSLFVVPHLLYQQVLAVVANVITDKSFTISLSNSIKRKLLASRFYTHHFRNHYNKNIRLDFSLDWGNKHLCNSILNKISQLKQ